VNLTSEKPTILSNCFDTVSTKASWSTMPEAQKITLSGVMTLSVNSLSSGNVLDYKSLISGRVELLLSGF
jgi:hypothetical protein